MSNGVPCPFGMQIQSRSYTAPDYSYRFGFNGKECDQEVNGSGNLYDYGFRVYNPRIGRFFSVDPLFQSYPWFTPYQFAGNQAINSIDLDGLEQIDYRISSFLDEKTGEAKLKHSIVVIKEGVPLAITKTVYDFKGKELLKREITNANEKQFVITQSIVHSKNWNHDVVWDEAAGLFYSPHQLNVSHTQRLITWEEKFSPIIYSKQGILKETTKTTDDYPKVELDITFKGASSGFHKGKEFVNSARAIAEIDRFSKSLPPGTTAVDITVSVQISDLASTSISSTATGYSSYKELGEARAQAIVDEFAKYGITAKPHVIGDHSKPPYVQATLESRTITTYRTVSTPITQKMQLNADGSVTSLGDASRTGPSNVSTSHTGTEGKEYIYNDE